MQQTLENYINRKSFWHKLNPVIKIIVTILFLVIIFLPIGFFGLTISFVSLAIIWFSSRLPFKTLKSILFLWLFMFALLFIINWIAYKTPQFQVDVNLTKNFIFGSIQDIISPHVFLYDGHYFVTGSLYGGWVSQQVYSYAPTFSGYSYVAKTALDGTTYYLWYSTTWYTLSTSVIFQSLSVSIKIALMIVTMTLLVATTTEIQLTNAINTILSPLKLFKIPINEWAMTIAIAIRYVPSLLQEAQNILKAQASRGVDFTNGNFKDKIKSIVSLVIPMFSIAFRKADDLSNAMEARNYSPRITRTTYRNYNVYISDIFVILFVGILFGFLVYFSTKKMIFAPFNWVEILI